MTYFRDLFEFSNSENLSNDPVVINGPTGTFRKSIH